MAHEVTAPEARARRAPQAALTPSAAPGRRTAACTHYLLPPSSSPCEGTARAAPSFSTAAAVPPAPPSYSRCRAGPPAREGGEGTPSPAGPACSRRRSPPCSPPALRQAQRSSPWSSRFSLRCRFSSCCSGPSGPGSSSSEPSMGARSRRARLTPDPGGRRELAALPPGPPRPAPPPPRREGPERPGLRAGARGAGLGVLGSAPGRERWSLVCFRGCERFCPLISAGYSRLP